MTTATLEAPVEHLVLDEKALKAASSSLDEGAVTPSYGPWRDDIVKLLNDALATELVCVLRYKRHYFTADGVQSPAIADEFLVHANEESAHADKIAERIVQLGGEPDFSPDSLQGRSHAQYDDSKDLLPEMAGGRSAFHTASPPTQKYRQSAPQPQSRLSFARGPCNSACPAGPRSW